MIKLHQYPSIWVLPSLSPFCIKVEAFLRKKNIPYHVVVNKNPGKGPKGKMPFLKSGNMVIPDSTFILNYLDPLPVNAVALAVQRMVEEHLYFVLLYSRWIDPKGFRILQRDFLRLFPPLIGRPFLRFLRYRLKKQAYAQGIGRHTRKEVYELGRRDIDALAELLGKKQYFLGTEYSHIDATVYGFLITIIKQPIDSELKNAVLSHQNLVEYCRREERALFPEFAV